MNWTGISDKSLFGKILRLPLRMIPRNLEVRILQGTLRGKRWIVGSGNHGYWLGSYEFGKSQLMEKTIRPGMVIYDLGANVGYYTLVASTLAGPAGKVFSFEPLPRNLAFLREHVRRNHAGNVTIYAAAVSDRGGTALFSEDASSARGKIGAGGTLEVQTVGLDELVERGEIPAPDLLKIDIEGAEFTALQGARKLLGRTHPPVFLSTHGKEVHRQCCEFLAGLGYSLAALDGKPLDRSKDLFASPPGA